MTTATQSMPQFIDPTSFNGKLYNYLLNKPDEARRIGFSPEDIARANFEKKQQQAEYMINRARDAQEAPTIRHQKPLKTTWALSNPDPSKIEEKIDEMMNVVPDEQQIDLTESDDEDDYEMRATDSDSDEDIIEIVEADAQKSPPAKKSPAKKTDNFEDLTNDELKSLCRSAALPVSGNKAELVARLLSNQSTAAKKPPADKSPANKSPAKKPPANKSPAKKPPANNKRKRTDTDCCIIEKHAWNTGFTEIGGEGTQTIKYKEFGQLEGLGWQFLIQICKDTFTHQSSATIELFDGCEWKILDDIFPSNMATEHPGVVNVKLTAAQFKRDRDTLEQRARIILLD